MVVSVLVGAAFLAWVSWTVWDHARPPVRGVLLTYDTSDPYQSRATVRVVLRDDDVAATCLLRAYAADHTTVGELSFAPDPATGPTYVESVRTERQATSVELVGCGAD